MLARTQILFARLPAVILIVCASGPLLGCPSDKTKSADPPATCARAGDTCMFSPGKLGLCIESVDGRPSLLCQSQH
jgi:hypothetical protein